MQHQDEDLNRDARVNHMNQPVKGVHVLLDSCLSQTGKGQGTCHSGQDHTHCLVVDVTSSDAFGEEAEVNFHQSVGQ